jgi:glycosyltransferase involved in cell wall biosynthesis
MPPIPAESAHATAAVSDPDLAGGPMLRVIGVDPELDFAGGESQVLGLTLELRREGHRTELLCDPRGALWRRAGEAGVVCHPLAIRNAVDLRAGLRLRRFLRRAHYDVVHFHTSRAHALAPFAQGLAGALIVTRRMDYRPNRLFAPYLYNRAVDAVAAISGGVADSLTAAGVARDRIAIVPSGVDTEHFRPPSDSERAAARAWLKVRDDQVAIGTVGALEARKGHRTLIEALAQPNRDGSRPASSALRCFIAGDGPLKEDLAAAIRSHGLDDQVRLLGAIDDPRQVLHALDIFAFPSRQEGLGVALLEAMASGLPAVASRVGGIGDAVEDGRTGFLVAPDHAAQLHDGIMRLAAEPATRETFGAAAPRRIVERFSMPAMARATLALYRVCLARSTRKVIG